MAGDIRRRHGSEDSSQRSKFEQAARELGTDDDPERFKDRVRALAKAPPSRHADKAKTTKPGR